MLNTPFKKAAAIIGLSAAIQATPALEALLGLGLAAARRQPV